MLMENFLAGVHGSSLHSKEKVASEHTYVRWTNISSAMGIACCNEVVWRSQIQVNAALDWCQNGVRHIHNHR